MANVCEESQEKFPLEAVQLPLRNFVLSSCEDLDLLPVWGIRKVMYGCNNGITSDYK